MKISKLFHWLYATLMFLPFIFLLPTLAYYGFNEHASAPSTTEQDYEQVYIDFNQLVQNGNFEDTSTWTTTNSSTLTVNDNVATVDASLQYGGIRTNITPVKAKYLFTFDVSSTYTSVNLNIFGNNFGFATTNVMTRKNYIIDNTYTDSWFIIFSADVGTFNVANVQLFNLTQMFGEGNEPTISEFNALFTESYYEYTLSHNEWINVPLQTTSTYVDFSKNINFAWKKVWDLPCFKWCSISFVSSPITYLTGLFGMAPDNPFNYVLTYFVSISVCWLVFDFLMYVPNLAHRWLDKGALE